LENELSQNFPLLNEDQCSIYDSIIHVVQILCEYFFVNGLGDIRKMFLYNTLLVKVRLYGKITLIVASSKIAILLINGDRTAHSRFMILIKLNESLTCNISRSSKEAYLIKMAKLFIWNKAPMIYKFAFEAVDQTFRNIMQVDRPFK